METALAISSGSRIHPLVRYCLLGVPFVFLLALLSLNVGPHGSLFWKLLDGSLTAEDTFVLFQLRLPRVLLAFAVGSILAISGVMYQSLFHNPLASPYTLGVSAGAACGVAIARGVLRDFVPDSLVWMFSLAGGMIVCVALFPFLIRKKAISPERILLIGVLFSLFAGSIVFFLQYLMDSGGIVELTSWYFGTLSVVGLEVPLIVLVASLILFVLLYRSAALFDLLLFGDSYAFSHGVSSKRVFLSVLMLTTLALALVVSVAGPIGFLGLIVPHMSRSLVGSAHHRLIPHAFLSGGIFLLLCDVMSRAGGQFTEIPVGLVTTIIGCPLMLVLLVKRASH